MTDKTPTDAQQYLNVASQCAATATSELTTNVLVDGGSGTLRELLNDAADAIRAGWGQQAQAAAADCSAGQPCSTCPNKKACQRGCIRQSEFISTEYHAAQAADIVTAPAPPPECETEAEKRAFAFGWFKAFESERMKADNNKKKDPL